MIINNISSQNFEAVISSWMFVFFLCEEKILFSGEQNLRLPFVQPHILDPGPDHDLALLQVLLDHMYVLQMIVSFPFLRIYKEAKRHMAAIR